MPTTAGEDDGRSFGGELICGGRSSPRDDRGDAGDRARQHITGNGSSLGVPDGSVCPLPDPAGRPWRRVGR